MKYAIFDNSQDLGNKNAKKNNCQKFCLMNYTYLYFQEFPHEKEAAIIGNLNLWIINFFIIKKNYNKMIY